MKTTKTRSTANSTEQGPSWEVDSRSADQETPHLLWNEPEGSLLCSH
jgi:hypothetical protein